LIAIVFFADAKAFLQQKMVVDALAGQRLASSDLMPRKKIFGLLLKLRARKTRILFKP